MFLIMQSLTNLQLSLMELKINLMRKRSLKTNHLTKRLILLQSISLVKTLSQIFIKTLMKKRRLLYLRASRLLNQKKLRTVIIIMRVRKREMSLMRTLRKNRSKLTSQMGTQSRVRSIKRLKRLRKVQRVPLIIKKAMKITKKRTTIIRIKTLFLLQSKKTLPWLIPLIILRILQIKGLFLKVIEQLSQTIMKNYSREHSRSKTSSMLLGTILTTLTWSKKSLISNRILRINNSSDSI